MLSRSEELEEMKRIDFCQFASSRGYVLDRRASSRCSAVLRHANGDKLIVGRSKAGHYIFFNVHGNDSGTILDFVMAQDRVSLGGARKVLRDWIGGSPLPPPKSPALPFQLQPSEHDAARVMAKWMQTQSIRTTHPYLERGRGIPQTTLTDPIFADRIRIDRRGNAVFPHFKQNDELCGFEIKNRGFTGFSPGGIKGLAASRRRADEFEFVICETAIDMLSVAAIEGTGDKRFFSTAGQVSELQQTLLINEIRGTVSPPKVLLAMDNDEAGHRLATKIRTFLIEEGVDHSSIVDHFPAVENADWNDVLRDHNADSTAILRPGSA